MVDAVVSVLLEKVVTTIQDEANHVHEFPEQLSKLKEEIFFMQSYLKDVDKVKVKNQNDTLKTSVQKLRELLYDVEDIIADCELMFLIQERRQGTCYLMCCSPSFLKFRYQMGKKLAQKNKEITSFREQMISYLGTTLNFPKDEYVMGGSRSTRYPILINEAEIVGLDDDANKIIEWVMQEDGSLKVIGIVGMGGIGKTTLAEKICNNDCVRGHFDHVLMVTASQNFELKEMVKGLLRKLNKKKDNITRQRRWLLEEDERELLEGLHGQLEGKYLLIFDDVWDTNGLLQWWESLKSALPQRNDGSCVIVTTRQDSVAKSMGALKKHIHHPQLLSIESSWSLFCKIAFAREGGHGPDPKLDIIGKAIITKCRGLPLAIKVVGGIMLGKEHSVLEWTQIYERLNEEVHKKGELILSTLQLSYQELPMHLKPCMLYFASFPEDSVILCWNMISRWIGEGFLRGKDGKTTWQIGQECLDELVSRGLLVGVEKYFSEEKFQSYRVHDMVREMIIRTAKEENFMNLVGSANTLSCVQSRRVVLTEDDVDRFFNKADKKVLQLRTLIAQDLIENKVCISKVYKLKWLRVLNLSFSETGDDDDDAEKQYHWSHGIGSLRHLIHLGIENSRMESLPDTIINLQNLQFLGFFWCPRLKRFPRQLTSLEKLTTIIIYACNSLEYFPKGIGNLSNLELLDFVPARSEVREGCRLSELKKLTQLRELGLIIKSEDHLEDEELHVLSELKQLKCLEIVVVESKTDEQKEQLLKKMNYELPLWPQLQELLLWYFPGKETPIWLNPTTLPNLRFLRIVHGNITHMCPEFFQKSEEENKVWRLEVLDLQDLEEMEEEWPRMHMVMPSLRLLIITGCPKLKSFPCDVEKHGTWRKEQEEMGNGSKRVDTSMVA